MFVCNAQQKGGCSAFFFFFFFLLCTSFLMFSPFPVRVHSYTSPVCVRLSSASSCLCLEESMRSVLIFFLMSSPFLSSTLYFYIYPNCLINDTGFTCKISFCTFFFFLVYIHIIHHACTICKCIVPCLIAEGCWGYMIPEVNTCRHHSGLRKAPTSL